MPFLAQLGSAPNLHSRDRCAFCGAPVDELDGLGADVELVATVILLTRAPGARCADTVACVRRCRRGRAA